MPTPNILDKKEQEILKEQEKIKAAEDRIENEQKQILDSEKAILSSIKKEGITPFGIEPGLTSKELSIARLLF